MPKKIRIIRIKMLFSLNLWEQTFESEDPSLKPDESLSGADELDMNAFEIANLGKGSSRALKLPAKTLPISLDVGESNRLRDLGRRKRCILSK